MRTPIFLGALALASCGPAADPRDAWTGLYRGSWVSDARDCATGERLEPFSDSAFPIEVIRVGDHLAIDGRCLIEFDLVDDTHARFRAGACDFFTSDGTPVHVVRVSGNAELDGPELFYMLSERVETPGACDLASSTFVGLRL